MIGHVLPWPHHVLAYQKGRCKKEKRGWRKIRSACTRPGRSVLKYAPMSVVRRHESAWHDTMPEWDSKRHHKITSVPPTNPNDVVFVPLFLSRLFKSFNGNGLQKKGIFS